MGDSLEQNAEGLQRLRKAIEAPGHDLAEHPFDRDHVRTRLGVFSAVLSGLCSRVLALGIESQAWKMEIYEINTPLRAAAFLAQIAHESDELKYFEEIWGPTPAQKRYEGRSDLGNTEPGDGYRFRGRDPIQLTGRSNYKKYGDLLGVDFVSNPDLAARPEFAFQAALYWESHGLNDLADAKDFITITKRINGGLNGLADRQRYCEVAKKALGLTL